MFQHVNSSERRQPVLFLAVALWATGSMLVGCAPPQRIERPDVLLITLDTTRRDHLSLYGYERATSPNLDDLGREAVVYTNAQATSSWTLPSHASLFTGLFPRSHGARRGSGGTVNVLEHFAPEAVAPVRPLDPEAETMASVLSAQGYATGAVVAGPYLNQTFGVAQGFDFYDDSGVTKRTGALAAEVTDSAIAWLQSAGEGPRFLFLNYFDPHIPYYPPLSHRDTFLSPGAAATQAPIRKLDAIALYDAEILYMDHHLGRLFDFLRETGAWDRTMIVVTSDHGEEFGDNNVWGHGTALTESLVSVPMIVKLPAGEVEPARDGRPISGVDVLPMILARLELPIHASVQGRADGRDSLLSELHHAGDHATRSLRKGRYKLVSSTGSPPKLFDLEADPAEREDVAKSHPVQLQELVDDLDRIVGDLPAADLAEPAHVDEATREALEQLGYTE